MMKFERYGSGKLRNSSLAILALAMLSLSGTAVAAATCWRSADGGYAYLCNSGKKVTQDYLFQKYGSGWGEAEVRAECGC